MCLYRSITDAVSIGSSSFCPVLDEDRLLILLFQTHSLYLIRQRCPLRTVDFEFDDTTTICPYVKIQHIVDVKDEKCEYNCTACDHERQTTSCLFDCDNCNQFIAENKWPGRSIDQVRAGVQGAEHTSLNFASRSTTSQPVTYKIEKQDLPRSIEHKFQSGKPHKFVATQHTPRTTPPTSENFTSFSCQSEVGAVKKVRRLSGGGIVLEPSDSAEADTDSRSGDRRSFTPHFSKSSSRYRVEPSTNPVIAELRRVAAKLQHEMDSTEHKDIEDAILDGSFVEALQQFAANTSTADRLPASRMICQQPRSSSTMQHRTNNASRSTTSANHGIAGAEAGNSPIPAASAGIEDVSVNTPATPASSTATTNIRNSPSLKRTASTAFDNALNKGNSVTPNPSNPTEITSRRSNAYRRPFFISDNLAATTNPFPPNFDINEYVRDWCRRFVQRQRAHDSRQRNRLEALERQLRATEDELTESRNQYNSLLLEQVPSVTFSPSGVMLLHDCQQQQQQEQEQEQMETDIDVECSTASSSFSCSVEQPSRDQYLSAAAAATASATSQNSLTQKESEEADNVVGEAASVENTDDFLDSRPK